MGTLAGLTNSLLITCNALLSICIIRERSVHLYVTAVFAVTGIILMTQPEFLFENANLAPPPRVNWTSPCQYPSQVVVNITSTVQPEANQIMSPLFNYTGIVFDEYDNLNKELLISYILVLVTGITECLWYHRLG